MSKRVPQKIVFIILLFACSATLAHAQTNRQILSVTPPLFQVSVLPGDIWQSSIRVVNGNSYELAVYAELVNFAPVGEKGQGRFIPLLTDDTTSTLAEWIEVTPGPYLIPPEQSRDIPFFIEVPENAPPGGHFAAVLIGTQPPQTHDRLALQTSQAVTSLFFMRVEGDILESGDIREFSVEGKFSERPVADFILRFENKGNVHLQPKGDIIITNMWGKERGVIPINHKSHFGNVLPSSIRAFNFSWRGEASITEIGRYKAIVTLAYGEDGIKNTYATTYFWVIPFKGTLITLGIVIAFMLFLIWAIRAYVRRMLLLAGVAQIDTREESAKNVGTDKTVPIEKHSRVRDLRLISYRHVTAPLKWGALDLRLRLREVNEFVDVLKTVANFIANYRIFFSSILVLVIGFVVAVLFIADASLKERSYEVIIEENGVPTTVTSEEIDRNRAE
jgi:hypothetical protein